MSSNEQNEGGATSKMETSMMTEVVDEAKLERDGNVR